MAAVAPSTGHYPLLTGARAVASFAVVVTHVAYWTGRYRDETWGLLLARLDFGVALFFVLSGFLLFRKWVAAAATQRPTPAVTAYARSRLRRIMPAYVVVVLLAFAVVPTDVGSGLGSLAQHLTLTQVYGPGEQHRGLTQMWSLTAEAAFYVLLPILAGRLVGARGRRRAGGPWSPTRTLLGVGALAAVTVAWFVVTRTLVVLPLPSIYWLPNYLGWFAGGMALAVVAVHVEGGGGGRLATLARAVAAAPMSTWVLAAALLVVASTPLAGEATVMPLPLSETLSKHLLYAAAATLLVAPLVLAEPGARPGSAGTSWLGGRPLTWLGEISYEVFLVHVLVIEVAMRLLDYPTFGGDAVTLLVVTVPVSVGVAWALERTVRAGLRLGTRSSQPVSG